MKKVFSDEVANSLGYQKYWPEKSDWTLAIFLTLAVMGVILGITLFVMDKTGYTQREEERFELRRATILEWCKTSSVKNLSETKECLNYKNN